MRLVAASNHTTIPTPLNACPVADRVPRRVRRHVSLRRDAQQYARRCSNPPPARAPAHRSSFASAVLVMPPQMLLYMALAPEQSAWQRSLNARALPTTHAGSHACAPCFEQS